MRSRKISGAIAAALWSLALVMGLALFLVGCDRGPKPTGDPAPLLQTPAGALGDSAAIQTRDAVFVRLDQAAAEHPELAGDVAAIKAAWSTSPERDTYDHVVPILNRVASDHPDAAASITDLLASWDYRLRKFGR